MHLLDGSATYNNGRYRLYYYGSATPIRGVGVGAFRMNESLKKTLLAVVAACLLGYAGYAVWSSWGGGSVVANANTRTLMDSETGELFRMRLRIGMSFPLENPKTGKKTLYPTEVCWAGKCLKKGGTHVILNHWLGKKGPTYCPVCGSLVVPHNPGPKYPPKG